MSVMVEEKTAKSKARQQSTAKGRRIMKIARGMFEAKGALVEVARNNVRWFPKPGGGVFPLSMRHDFFGVWDAIVVWKTRRIFIQVTELSNMSHRRDKILASGFPVSKHDLILGYRGRSKFRVLRGPSFEGEAEEMIARRSTP